jgi:hypothetical protein
MHPVGIRLKHAKREPGRARRRGWFVNRSRRDDVERAGVQT